MESSALAPLANVSNVPLVEMPEKREAKPSVENNEEDDDTPCAVCLSDFYADDDAILFCDGCNLAVHQTCYGVVDIPEDDWFCSSCTRGGDGAKVCELCPAIGGALKPTTTGKMAHISCASYTNGVVIQNDDTTMEPIDLSGMDPEQFKLKCYVCGVNQGSCVQCCKKGCYKAFHVTCAAKHEFEVTVGKGCHCHLHHSEKPKESFAIHSKTSSTKPPAAKKARRSDGGGVQYSEPKFKCRTCGLFKAGHTCPGMRADLALAEMRNQGRLDEANRLQQAMHDQERTANLDNLDAAPRKRKGRPPAKGKAAKQQAADAPSVAKPTAV